MPEPGPRPTRVGLWVDPRGGRSVDNVTTGVDSAGFLARGFAGLAARRAFGFVFVFAFAIGAYPLTAVTRTRCRTWYNMPRSAG